MVDEHSQFGGHMTDSEPSGLGTASLSMGGASLPPIALPPLSLPPLKTSESHLGLSPMGLSYPSPSITQSMMASPLMTCGSSPMNVGSNAAINSPLMYRPPQSPQNQATQYGAPGSSGGHMDGFVTSPGPPKSAQRKSRPRPRVVNRQLMDTIQTSPNSSNSGNMNSRQIKSVPVSPSSSNPPTPSSVPMMRYNSIEGAMGSPCGSPSSSIIHSPASHPHNMVLNGQSPCQSPKPNGFHPVSSQGPPTPGSHGGQGIAHVSVHHVQSTGDRSYQNDAVSLQGIKNQSLLAQQLSKPSAARPPRPAQQSVLIEHKNLPPRDDHPFPTTSRSAGPPGPPQQQQSISHITVIPSSGSHQERSMVAGGGRSRVGQNNDHSNQQNSQAIVQHLPLRVGSSGPTSTANATFQVRNTPYASQQQNQPGSTHAVIQHQQLPPLSQTNHSAMPPKTQSQHHMQTSHSGGPAIGPGQTGMGPGPHTSQQQYTGGHIQPGKSQDYTTTVHEIPGTSQEQQSRMGQSPQTQPVMYPVATVSSHPVSRTGAPRPRPPTQNNSTFGNASITVSMQSSSGSSGVPKNNRSRPPAQSAHLIDEGVLPPMDQMRKPVEQVARQELKRDQDQNQLQQVNSGRSAPLPMRMGQQQYFGEAGTAKNQAGPAGSGGQPEGSRQAVPRTKQMPPARNMVSGGQTTTEGIPQTQQMQRQMMAVNRNQKPAMQLPGPGQEQSGQQSLSQDQIKRILAQRRPVVSSQGTAAINGQNGQNNGHLQSAARLPLRIGSQGPQEQKMTIPPQSHLRSMLGGMGSTPTGAQRMQTTQMVPGMGPPVIQRPPPQAVAPQILQLAQSIDNQRQMNQPSNKDQFRSYKRKFKCLVYENECYQEELRNLQRKLLKLSRDKNFLLDRLMNYEKFSDSSDYESDASQQTVTDRPKARKRVRTSQAQRKRSTVSPSGSRIDDSISGTPSPCPSPSPSNHHSSNQPGPSGINKPSESKIPKGGSSRNRRMSMPLQNQSQIITLDDMPGPSGVSRGYSSDAQHIMYNKPNNLGEHSEMREEMPNGGRSDDGVSSSIAQHHNLQEGNTSHDRQILNGTYNQMSYKKEDFTDSDATDIGDVLE